MRSSHRSATFAEVEPRGGNLAFHSKTMEEMTAGTISIAWLARATLLIVFIVSLTWVVWELAYVLLLLLGAIVVASILTASQDLIAKYTRLPGKWALGVAILLLALVIAGFLFLMGSQLVGQFAVLRELVPGAIENVENNIGIDFQEHLERSGWMSRLAGFAPNLVGAIGSVVLIIVAGLFLALDPKQYRDGLLLLLPISRRQPVRRALDNAGRALRLWLIGKLMTMIIVGAFTAIGLYVLGVPSPLALGLIAGLLEFIPFVGPILAFIPAGAVALSSGQSSFWWVLGLYFLIQQLENNLLVPLVQQRTAKLSPVLGLFAVVALGVLFGPLGVILGTPLTIIVMVMVRQLYIRNTLGDDNVSIPGQQEDGGSPEDR